MAEVVEDLEDKINSKAQYVQVAWYLTIIGLVVIFIYTVGLLSQ